MKATTTTITEKSLLKTMKDLPDSFVAEDLIERMILLQKIEEGLAAVRTDGTLSQAELNSSELSATEWHIDKIPIDNIVPEPIHNHIS